MMSSAHRETLAKTEGDFGNLNACEARLQSTNGMVDCMNEEQRSAQDFASLHPVAAGNFVVDPHTARDSVKPCIVAQSFTVNFD